MYVCYLGYFKRHFCVFAYQSIKCQRKFTIMKYKYGKWPTINVNNNENEQ